MVLTSILAASVLLAPQGATPSKNLYREGYSGLVADAQKDKKVSLHYDDASLKDVLNGLKKQKIDFAVDADAFKDRRVSLNLNDVPLRSALNAIATALDAHWETVGSVRVLKKGAGFSRLGQGVNDGLRTFEVSKGFESGLFDGKAMKAFGKAQKQFRLNGLSGTQGEEFRKALEETRKSMDGAYKTMSPKDAEEFRKAMERIRGEKTFKFDSIDKKAFEGMQNRIEMRGLMNDEARKSLANSRGDVSLQGEEMRKVLEKARGAIDLGGKGLDSLLKSITPEQKELAKKQGFLKVSDLTPEQKKLAGIKEGGTIEITIVRDGETLKIKGE